MSENTWRRLWTFREKRIEAIELQRRPKRDQLHASESNKQGIMWGFGINELHLLLALMLLLEVVWFPLRCLHCSSCCGTFILIFCVNFAMTISFLLEKVFQRNKFNLEFIKNSHIPLTLNFKRISLSALKNSIHSNCKAWLHLHHHRFPE